MEVQVCDNQVDRFGRIVCQLQIAPTEDVEKFVRTVRMISNQRVDWQYVNKYPTILAVGDVAYVRQIVLDNIADFEGIAIYSATDPK